MPTRCSFLAQDPDGNRLDRGLHGERGRVLGLDPSIGLAVLTVASDADGRAARVAAEVLLDDMQANLASVTQSEVVDEAPGLICLRESLANIEEYLREEQQGEVSLGAVQIDDAGRISLALAGDLRCCLKQERVRCLGAESSRPLGAAEPAEPLLLELTLAQTPCLLLLPTADERVIDPEYVQLSLGRFCDAPEMLLRQLTVRGQRNGLVRAPSLLFAAGEAEQGPKKGLFSRLVGR